MDGVDDILAKYGAGAPAEAPAAPGGGIDDILTKYSPQPAAPAAAPADDEEEPGLLEAGLRGAKQGVTFGFGDEITGALESAFTAKTYKQARDEARANDKRAREAHPIGFGVGEILGGAATALVPGAELGMLGRGVAGAAARGAGAGILQGAGDSEASSVGGVVQDAAKSGLVGAGVGAILGGAASKYVHGAEERADRQLVSDLGERATPTQRARLAAKGEKVVDVARREGLDTVATKPTELAARQSEAADRVGSALSEITRKADDKAAGIPLDKVTNAYERLADNYRKNPATKPVAEAVDRQLQDIKVTWGQGGVGKAAGPGTLVPSDEVRQFASAVAKEGFSGNPLEPSVAKNVRRKAWAATKDILNDHVDTVLGKAEGKRFRDLNQDYAVLSDIGAAAEKRSALSRFSATGLRQIAGENLGKLGVVASVVSGNPLPVLATHVGLPIAKAANKGATRALAALARAVKSGDGVAEAAQAALASGVPRGTIEAWAPGVAAALTPDADAN